MDNNITKAVLGAGAVAVSLFGFYIYNKMNDAITSATNPNTANNNKSNTNNNLPDFDKVEVSLPFNQSKDFSISYDPVSGKFQGVPHEVMKELQKAGISEEDIKKNPLVARDILYNLDYEKVRRGSISAPISSTHNVHIYVDPKTNRIEGIPPVIKEALLKLGKTEEEIYNDPQSIKEFLYKFSQEDVFQKPEISGPVSFSHDFSIKLDPATGAVTGVPKEIEEAIKLAGYTVDQVLKNPTLVRDLLYNFDYNSMKPDAPKISSPENVSHDFSITVDPATGDIKGIPQDILDAIKNAGYTTKQIIEKPEILKAILYNFDYASLSPSAPKITRPTKVTKDFSITIDPSGNVSGVPQEILDAIKNAGYTPAEVLKNPDKVKDLLYNFDYNSLKPDAPKISAPSGATHDFQISYDPKTGEFKGIPEAVLKAIRDAGHSLEDVVKNPELVKDLLYNLEYDQLKQNLPAK